jgi:hypothetical protein
MRRHTFIATFGALFALGAAGTVRAQDATRQLSARQELQAIHRPRSIDQELGRLTKDLELTPHQRKRVKILLLEHHNRIQALLDKNPTASRQALGPKIHAISDRTHHEVHALLSARQKRLEAKMVNREHNGEEYRRPLHLPG